MPIILSWLLRLFSLVPTRVLFSLGFGFLSYSGYSAAIQTLASQVTGVFGSLSADIYGVASLAGFVDGVGVLLSALIATAALAFIDRFAKLPS